MASLTINPFAIRAPVLLRDMFAAAVASANPLRVLGSYLPERPQGRCVIVGAGKAAWAMARAVELAWPDVDIGGAVVTPYGAGGHCERIDVLEAGHPVPDAASEAAARRMLREVSGLTAEDLVLALISGGGSATLALPRPGLTLADKQQTGRVLLKSGLDIRTMNMIRRRLSGIKGGRLALAACPARVVTLGISDIPGDDPRAIASGPTLPDEDLDPIPSEALDLIGDQLPPAVVKLLREPEARMTRTTAADFRMIATPGKALEAAAGIASDAGFSPVILGDAIEGEARDVAQNMARMARAHRGRPTAYLSGGETTVTIGNDPAGAGGRNTEFLLSLALALGGSPGVWAIAADTDGEDGASGGSAGAVIDPTTLERAAALGLQAESALARHDSGTFFDVLGDLVTTGPTRTNVNDFRAILVAP